MAASPCARTFPRRRRLRGQGAKPTSFKVHVGGRSFQVDFKDGKAHVNGRVLDYSLEAGGVETLLRRPLSGGEPVNAQMPGKILKHLVSVGQQVAEGDALLLIEAMKMEMEVAAPRAGTVTSIPADEGQQVAAGEPWCCCHDEPRPSSPTRALPTSISGHWP